jgi:hypothetical protein
MRDRVLDAIKQASAEVGLQLVVNLCMRAQEILDAADSPQRFNEFWLLYPRKVGKPAAANAWRRADGDKHFNLIQTNVASRLASEEWKPDATGMQYILHPTTYLNQRRWLDACVPKEMSRFDL